MKHEWFEDVLHPLDDRLARDMPHAHRSFIPKHPERFRAGDVVVIEHRLGLLERLFNRVAPPPEIVRVSSTTEFGATVERGFAITTRRSWFAGDHLRIISHVGLPHG